MPPNRSNHSERTSGSVLLGRRGRLRPRRLHLRRLRGFAEILQDLAGGFILSLNDVPEVGALFAWADFHQVATTYAIAQGDGTPAAELIITGGTLAVTPRLAFYRRTPFAVASSSPLSNGLGPFRAQLPTLPARSVTSADDPKRN